MKHTKLLICALALALLVTCAELVLAQCGSGGSGGCGATPPAKSSKTSPALAPVLSVAQKTKMAQIEKARQAKIAAAQPKFNRARQEIEKLSANPKSSDAAITAKIKEAMGYQAQIVAANMIAQRQKDRVLTPAQAKQIAASQGGCGGGCGGGGGSAPKASSGKPAASGGGCGSSSGCGG
jgi:Spy/CpxP family protein refolding chaperone